MNDFPQEKIEDQADWGVEAYPQDVTITSLQMLDSALAEQPSELPQGVRIERAQHVTPELVRWFYAVVGGPYRWYERLGWSREHWQEELDSEGSEVWILTLDGTPAGYCQLSAELTASSIAPTADVEILYFGLMDWAHGKGLGRLFLQTVIQRAWDIPNRHHLPEVHRVWVHTCNLDGPHALANYQARGLSVYEVEQHQEIVLKQPLGSWSAMFAQ